MKRALLPILLALPVIQIGGCSAEDAPPVVTGTAGTGMNNMAGTPATGTGGSDVGTSGSGATPSAGTANTSMSGSTSTGGTPGAGGTGTSGSGTGGTGITAGTGTGGGTGETGGTGGGSAGTGTGGSTAAPVSVGKLDGMLVTTPCGDTPAGDDCAGGGWIYEGKNTACSGGKLDSDVPSKSTLDFPITGGVMGTHYIATMHFYGMMEPKNYGPTVTREAGTMRPNDSQNPSKPEPFATAPGGSTVATTDYNNYEIHSFDEKGTEIKQYYINSDTQQGHYVFAINYERPIEIVSGGKVHVRIYDNNCRMIKNCLGGPPCEGKARSIDLTGASPMPMGLTQPGLGKADKDSGQWFFIDVKNIVAK